MITATNLRKRFGDRLAVDGLSLHVPAGEVFGLLGPNGAGKTTTLAMLSTLLRPDSGEVQIGGFDALREPRKARRRLGLVPQEIALYPALTAAENLSFLGRLYGLSGAPLRRRCAELLELVGLVDRARDIVGTFSGGMRRRLSIACALLHDPAVLLMDEPTVGLDAQSRAHLLEFVGRLSSQRKAAIIFTTHHMEEAERVCDRLAVLDRGRILAEGSTDALIAAHGEVPAAPPRASLETVFLALTGRSLRD